MVIVAVFLAAAPTCADDQGAGPPSAEVLGFTVPFRVAMLAAEKTERIAALPVQRGAAFVPDGAISGAHFGVWAILSLAILYLAGAF